MMKAIKVMARDSMPRRFQVPAKYWFGVINRSVEAEMGLLEKLVRPGDHVIDVGANRGIYTYRLWRLGARVEVFEPNPACLGVLTSWAAGKPGIAVHPVALSSQAGSASLRVPVDEAGIAHDASGSIEHGGFANAREQDVSMRTLDSFGFTDIGFIKIDVEGHEHSVIEGAVATFAASRPALLVEIEQRHNSRTIADVFGQIASLGYDGYFLAAGKLTALKDFEACRDQAAERFGVANQTYVNNFLFLHRERVATGRYEALLRDVVST
ncbi:FkbM family methyltransferase [Aurantimonas endophytica]|uniref:FkbM family methyltransferase n=1 Tax=Aurantimonas endophytica TaxID=1522175 RepID=A0A7W6HGJ4_9HYPH|nr:FkbM family methyltransferase [Aurantimonas endophytica]MBB4004829.1 FkbM family methyltransferase [Aurantimonas endophytica]MCO6405639.1 FkbM family methyltransferase [Aurantimonas endophytica]